MIVQGSIDKINTPKCITSIRTFLPEAEIILSTWENSDTSSLDYDKLVLSEDPGAIVFDLHNGKLNNINRVLLSTKRGLEKATRPYILKLRSDLVLLNDNILNYQDNFRRIDDYKLFKNRIYSSLLFSLKFENFNGSDKYHYRPFHISDWWYFGLNEDIKKLYDVPLVEEPAFSNYFVFNKPKPKVFLCFPYLLWRMSPEQYILSSCAKNSFPNIKFNDNSDYTPENIQQSEIIVVNNFLILDANQSGINNAKEEYVKLNLSSHVCKDGLYYPKTWLKDYKKYCDPDYKIPFKFIWKEDLKIEKDIKKLEKHFNRFISPFNWSIKWLEAGLASFSYVIKIFRKTITYFIK